MKIVHETKALALSLSQLAESPDINATFNKFKNALLGFSAKSFWAAYEKTRESS